MTGPSGVMTQAIEVPTPFRNFEDYWSPFLGGQSPAPGFARSLPEDRRIALLELIRRTLRTAPDGSIQLTARSWGVRGTKPEGPTPPGVSPSTSGWRRTRWILHSRRRCQTR